MTEKSDALATVPTRPGVAPGKVCAVVEVTPSRFGTVRTASDDALDHRYYVRRSKFDGVADRRLLVLVSLNDGRRHGYGIQQDIESFAGIRLGPGTLYGAIASLERDGLIRALPGEDRRRPYEMTPAGRRALQDELSAIAAVLRRAGAALA